MYSTSCTARTEDTNYTADEQCLDCIYNAKVDGYTFNASRITTRRVHVKRHVRRCSGDGLVRRLPSVTRNNTFTQMSRRTYLATGLLKAKNNCTGT